MGLIAKLAVKTRAAKRAAAAAAQVSDKQRRRVLLDVARGLERAKSKILTANRRDLAAGRRAGLADAMLERLELTPARIAQMAAGVRAVARLKDPLGRLLDRKRRPNGLKISKVSVPLGVVLIIFESRPNVTVECAALCIRSGNAVLLRGGKEAFHSNRVLAGIFQAALAAAGYPPAWTSFIDTTERKAVDWLLKREEEIDLVIPRGGESLIRKVAAAARMPVIKHYKGVCHVYVDAAADLDMAARIVLNAKLQRTSVCNAMETLLVHKKVAPGLYRRLRAPLAAAECEVRGDAPTRRHLPSAKKARPADYGAEFLDKVFAAKVVDNLAGAVEHIRLHGSGHTEAIVTSNKKAAQAFISQVDSSSVMVNASTRFADGFEYGLGAEIGISTDKIHARGPMGLEGLTTYKYVVEGRGQLRS
jgi:glutamate-5-semialdehyde dehydrogenase